MRSLPDLGSLLSSRLDYPVAHDLIYMKTRPEVDLTNLIGHGETYAGLHFALSPIIMVKVYAFNFYDAPKFPLWE